METFYYRIEIQIQILYGTYVIRISTDNGSLCGPESGVMCSHLHLVGHGTCWGMYKLRLEHMRRLW